jgi:hypothetical protein
MEDNSTTINMHAAQEKETPEESGTAETAPTRSGRRSNLPSRFKDAGYAPPKRNVRKKDTWAYTFSFHLLERVLSHFDVVVSLLGLRGVCDHVSNAARNFLVESTYSLNKFLEHNVFEYSDYYAMWKDWEPIIWLCTRANGGASAETYLNIGSKHARTQMTRS